MSDDWVTEADRAEEADLRRFGYEKTIDSLAWELARAFGLLREAVAEWDAGTLCDGNHLDDWIAKAKDLLHYEGKGEEKA